jgi:uncharacterized surface protein with fasciclin (FAS1) repeats
MRNIMVARNLNRSATVSPLNQPKNWQGTQQERTMTSIRTLIISASATALLATASFANPMVGGAPMYANKNIIQNAVNSKDHTTLVAAVKAAGLVDTLQGKGPFTVLAPTNEAFSALPAGTVDTLLKPENKAQLVKILTCHVIAGDVMAKTIKKMAMADGGTHEVTTVGGCKLWLSAKGGMVSIKDESGGVAKVTIADVKQSNGVIHVINHVLLPKS